MSQFDGVFAYIASLAHEAQSYLLAIAGAVI